MLQNASLAEETAQDVFLRLYADYDKIQSAEHLMHWLRRTTTHRCLDILRQPDRRLRVPLEDVLETYQEPPRMGGDPLLSRRLRRLIGELPAGARAVIVLRFQEDLEPHEIARLLELPINTVKSRLQRALTVLRAKLSSVVGGGNESHRR
jgi:RNA polymerase sigma-70 factor (ECF subfamily)